MKTKTFSFFAILLFLGGVLLADNVLFTLSDLKGEEDTKMTGIYSVTNEVEPGDLDLVSLSAKSHGDKTIFEATFARPIKSPDSRVISQAGATLKSYAPNGFYTFNLDIYVDTNGITGSRKTSVLPGRNAQITPQVAWEKVICLSPSPQYARVMLEEDMKQTALNEAISQKGSLTSEERKDVEQRVKSEIKAHVYFPTAIRVHGATVQFSVPDSFFQGKAKAEWGYTVGVTTSNIVERISRTGAGTLLNYVSTESRQRHDIEYVDFILPMKKIYSGKQ